MKELSLFTGAGGGVLGTKLLGWSTVGYVEINEYCQRVIAQRIKDGFLDEAPIFGDIRAFLRDGYARSYQGLVDVVTAGFPCQPFSIAGQRKQEKDERNLWPQTADVISAVRPKRIVLENVPALLNSRYFGRILSTISALGYGVAWGTLGAGRFGVPHVRERIFLVANANSIGYPRVERYAENIGQNFSRITGTNGPIRELPNGPYWEKRASESCFLGRNDVVPSRMDRLRAIGNAQFPKVVKTAWEILGPPL